MWLGSVLKTFRRGEYAELMGLYLLQGAALGMWFVPLSTVLAAHGLSALRSYAFATSAVAAFVTPLFFGAVADRHASPVRVLRWLALATAVTMALASTAIWIGAGPGVVLAAIQLHALCSAPTWSIASTVVFARIANSPQPFGPIRAMATIGWLGGCLVVSALGADQSTLSGYAGAVVWLAVAGITFLLPLGAEMRGAERLTWAQRLGLDALSLLRHRDHRVVFLTTALASIPLAGFYPNAPLHLQALGFERTAAWMSLGQITEVVAMLSLGALMLRWRLKWILAWGLIFGVVRFALSALDTPSGLVASILLHGGSYTLVWITAQIYLNERVDPAWRARGQALMSMLNGGVGNLAGYLSVGFWFTMCASHRDRPWTMFWGGLSLACAALLLFFLATYHGRGSGPRRNVGATQ
ncbi:MAG: MFS transporter [Opitutaceae bacterium]|nr:MFS transporter [Opitutaceae bacterium]